MKRRQFSSLLGGAALASLAGLRAEADPLEGCGVPNGRDDGWAVISVDHEKLIGRAALCRMTDGLVASGANVHAVLVARGGKLVFERYFKGLDEIPGSIFGRRVANVAFDVDTLHDIKSVSKSVASLAVGIAIDKGSYAASTNRSSVSSPSYRTCAHRRRIGSCCCMCSI